MDSEFNIQSGAAASTKSLSMRVHETQKREAVPAAAVSVAKADEAETKLLEGAGAVAAERQSDEKNQQKALERSQAEEAAREVSEFLNASRRGLEFSVDEKAGRTVVKVMDIKEEKVIRQIPTEEVLQLAQKVRELKEELSGKIGMLFESKA